MANGRAYHYGPFPHPAGDAATKITSVTFFDADGDKRVNAVVLAAYRSKSGATRHHNVILRWTGSGIDHLPSLESRIAHLETIAQVRSVLRR
jgi:hypothetical protein